MTVEARYVEVGDHYTLTIYGQHPNTTDQNQIPLRQRPDWLTDIVTIATIGELFLTVVDPPPNRVLWFFMDDDCNLISVDSFK